VRSLITVSTPVQAANPSMRRQVRILLPVYRAIGMRGPVRQGLLDGMLTDLARRTDPQAVDALIAPMSQANRGAIARTVHSGRPQPGGPSLGHRMRHLPHPDDCHRRPG